MKQEKLVSIIIPVYNVEKYIRKCLESVINQTYKNIEIIIVNDGSRDNSRKIIEEYLLDKRIEIIDKINEGQSSARNLGLKEAKGTYIYFLDSDDYIDKNTIEYLVNEMEQSKLDCLIHGILKESEKQIKEIKVINSNIEKLLTGREYLNLAFDNNIFRPEVWNKFYKKEIILKNNIKFIEGKKYEDFLFSLLYILKCSRVKIIQNPFYHYLQREGSTTHKLDRKIIDDILWMVKQVEIELNKDFLTLLENKNFRVYVVRWILANTIMKFEYFNYCYGFDKTKREFEYLRNNKVFIENTRILYKYRGNYKLKILLRVFYLRNLGWLKKFFLIRKNILKLKDIIIQK